MATQETGPSTSLNNQTHNPDYVVGSSGDAPSTNRPERKRSWRQKIRTARRIGAVTVAGAILAVGGKTVWEGYQVYQQGAGVVDSIAEGFGNAMEDLGIMADKVANTEPDYDAIAADANVQIGELVKLEVLEGKVSGVNRAIDDDPQGFLNKLNGQWEQGTGVGTLIAKVNLGNDDANAVTDSHGIENYSVMPKNISVKHTGNGNMLITVLPEAIEFGLEEFDVINPIYYEQVFGKWQRFIPEAVGAIDERALKLDGTLRDYIEAELVHECSQVMDAKLPAAITSALTQLANFLNDSGAKSIEVVIKDRVLPADVDSEALRLMALENGYENPDQISPMVPENGEGECVEVGEDGLPIVAPTKEVMAEAR